MLGVTNGAEYVVSTGQVRWQTTINLSVAGKFAT